MIIRRLFELAEREKLAEGIAFVKEAVPFVVQCDAQGRYLGIIDRRGTVEIPAKKKGQPPRTELDDGKEILCPRAHGNTANRGFARFFVDTLPRVLPYIVPAKSEKPKDIQDYEDGIRKSAASRATFWNQVSLAADHCDCASLKAVAELGRSIMADPELAKRIHDEVSHFKPGPGNRCTVACVSDDGITIPELPEVASWYRSYFKGIKDSQSESMPMGLCQITGEVVGIPKSHSFQFKGVRGGLSTGTYLVSMDKDAFQSYELDGTENTRIGQAATNGYSLALQALINDDLPSQGKTCLTVGKSTFLYWTRQPVDLSFMSLLDNPNPDSVRLLLNSAKRGKESTVPDLNDFYLLVLSANAARLVVRDYLEAPLEKISRQLAQWFDDLALVPVEKNDNGGPIPIWKLAQSTAFDGEHGPMVPDRLMMAALRGDPLPEGILNDVLGRLKVDREERCTRQRLSLVKLFLVRKGVRVSEKLDPDECHPAYLYGRLLEIFEEIQSAAIPGVNATVVDKFYTTFSSAPAMVFSRLFANAQNHLRKLRNDKPGAFVNLERKLTTVAAKLPAQAPAGVLALRDQGLFALGFYHQKAERNAEIASRKQARENAEDNGVNN